jgi:polyisoprenyl-phosphate glycosyltransferase
MRISVVIPVYNESDCIKEFSYHLLDGLSRLDGVDFDYWFVDDGSTDESPLILERIAVKDRRVHVLRLLGNHGHQRALIAALDHTTGDAVLMMDSDGQHPVAIAAEMICTFMRESDYDIVQGVRSGTQGGAWKNATSRLFYLLVNHLIPDINMEPGASDFRVMSAYAVDVVRSFPDRYRNLRILLARLRLPTKNISYQAGERIAGRSKYNWRKMACLATDGLFAFSSLPLRLSLTLMVISTTLGIGYMLYAILAFASGKTVPGWSSLIGLTAFLFTGAFGVLAIMAEYIARIYEDVRHHPIYIKQRQKRDPAPRSTSDPAQLDKC